MTTTLASELKRFCGHTRRLKQILDETRRCFDDINESGKHENGQLFSFELMREEEEEILSTAEKPPGIIILGENVYCKAFIVNEIFNRTIFPSFDDSDKSQQFRMVRFKHGENLCISLALPDDYALVDNLEAYNGPWNTIPRKDLQMADSSQRDAADVAAILEVSFNHQILRQGCAVLVSGSNHEKELEQVLSSMETVSPILLYAFQSETLAEQEQQKLKKLKACLDCSHYHPVFFIRVPSRGERELALDLPEAVSSALSKADLYQAPQQLISNDTPSSGSSPSLNSPREVPSTDDLNEAIGFASEISPDILPMANSFSGAFGKMKTDFGHKVLSASAHSSNIYLQFSSLGFFPETPGCRNLSAIMTGDYFEVESVLVINYDNFTHDFTNFVSYTLQRYLINAAAVLNNSHVRCLNTFITSAFDMARDILITPKKIEFARDRESELYNSLLQIALAKGDEIREMIGTTISANLDQLVKKAEEYDFIGVDFDEDGVILTHKGLKICTGQIQELVLGGLNQAIAGKLVSSVNILRDSYTGTLTRCLESLERIDRENPDGASTTQALKQILNAAYQVEITVRSSSSFIHFLLERMKQLVQAMPWSTPPKIDNDWKKRVASEMLNSLSANRLAKSISSQIKDRLSKSHEAFSHALKQLEAKHSGRLDKIEESRLQLRKVHAPRVAKVALESTSLKDVILYGMPQAGREIGRGQYGVVYSCDSWAGHSPCAIKSVVPPDDKHWNDLALEFFYTKNIPPHDRILTLLGSVIDYSYGGGTTPAVLLIMDRLQKDLYAAIKQGLDWIGRLQVSIDVVEGIRYLHNQGLVHRDIKMKNVLLDEKNRGRITDLGFCKPEAMISGSIVGTPIHMAPELFTGRYDNSVDVYAFGILFWYVCSGKVNLPGNFEQCANKDQLWTSVKKGLRPEKLSIFDDDCWNLMSKCWEGDPIQRPHLGNVHSRLEEIIEKYKKKQNLSRTSKESKHISAKYKYKMKSSHHDT
ncbi:hypothetical protein ACJMK2_016456 [Sinanodonta woodiana]|uniref:Dual serine/threonine and tyrosine protein kinase n=1 Tax=Sinanodonta woodiana TaxID=1069815 RepID=A0ABD3UX90_SINWO